MTEPAPLSTIFLPPAWTEDELRAMTPEERTAWWMERLNSWAIALISTLGSGPVGFRVALAARVDEAKLARAFKALAGVR